MRYRRACGVVLAFAAALLSACGGDDDDAATNGGGGLPAVTSEDPGAAEDGGATADGADEGGSSLEFTAVDIAFEPEEATATAGELEVTLVNEGEIEHTWLVENHEDELELAVEQNGDEDSGTISLGAGDYTYYCDVPGHRAAGMEGTLTVE